MHGRPKGRVQVPLRGPDRGDRAPRRELLRVVGGVAEVGHRELMAGVERLVVSDQGGAADHLEAPVLQLPRRRLGHLRGVLPVGHEDVLGDPCRDARIVQQRVAPHDHALVVPGQLGVQKPNIIGKDFSRAAGRQRPAGQRVAAEVDFVQTDVDPWGVEQVADFHQQVRHHRPGPRVQGAERGVFVVVLRQLAEVGPGAGEVARMAEGFQFRDDLDAASLGVGDEVAQLGFEVSVGRGRLGQGVELQRATLIVGEMPEQGVATPLLHELQHLEVIVAGFEGPRRIEHQANHGVFVAGERKQRSGLDGPVQRGPDRAEGRHARGGRGECPAGRTGGKGQWLVSVPVEATGAMPCRSRSPR